MFTEAVILDKSVLLIWICNTLHFRNCFYKLKWIEMLCLSLLFLFSVKVQS